MPKVIIIPYNQIENVCQEAVNYANNCQSDFSFYLIPSIELSKTPLENPSAEFIDILTFLDNIKRQFNYNSNDLLLTFYNGILKATEYGLSNLFSAGSRYDESPPCTGVISLKYIDWNILEEKYNYDLQKHSILHLIVSGLIGAYTYLEAHMETFGCLLDFNADLISFNKKLQKGYYLCSVNEKGCYDNLSKEKYGKSILRLCENFKHQNYKAIIKELIMGDKFENISNSTIINSSYLENSLNKNEHDKELVEVIKHISQLVENSGNKEAGESFDDFTEELSKQEPKKSKLKSYWNSLTSILPNILTITNITEKITKLIGQ